MTAFFTGEGVFVWEDVKARSGVRCRIDFGGDADKGWRKSPA